jgi:orotate phosphoribosyltransferase
LTLSEPPADTQGQSASGPEELVRLRERLLELVSQKGYERRTEPFQLSSGQWSNDYIDGKRALADGKDLLLAAKCVIALARERGIEFDAVGGLTMGADHLSHAIAVAGGKRWFSVRKEAKGHGRQRLIEGADLSASDRVVVLDDVVTTGKSVLQAIDAIDDVGATTVLAVTLVDRGRAARAAMEARGTPYEPLLTFQDLGIEQVGGDSG